MRDILRQEMLKRRLAMTVDEVSKRSEVIITGLLTSNDFEIAQVIMAYMSFRNEVSTDAIIAQAIKTGKRVAVPMVDREQRQLIPSELINFPADLIKGTWGIREPKQSCLRPLDPCLIDLVLVPGVVFDQTGSRLGYGFGFYDRFLVSLRTGVKRVALAYSFQLVEKLTTEEHDCPVDLIVTETKLINCQVSRLEKPNLEV